MPTHTPPVVAPRPLPLLAPPTPEALARARAQLRDQIAGLERRLADLVAAVPTPLAPSWGPHLLTLEELETTRDRLISALASARAAASAAARDQTVARRRLEAMLADPRAYKYVRIRNSDLGLPGCTTYHVRPRLGLLGMLAGWWEVKVSSGCPLAMARRTLAITAVIVLAVAGPASGKRHRPTAFSGRCDMSGTVSLKPGLTNSPQRVAQPARAAGTCSGTFVDAAGREHRLSGAPVTYSAESVAPSGSCLAGTATGSGVLGFPYGRLRFRLSETRIAALPVLRLSGARSGSALVLATPSPAQDPVAALQACSGAGLDTFRFDGRLQTTPRISG